MKISDTILFDCIRSFLTEYLPATRNFSPNTIRAYKQVLLQFLNFIVQRYKIKLQTVAFSHMTTECILAFLERVESFGNSVRTRNHRLACLRSFFAFAADYDITLVSCKAEIDRVKIKKDLAPVEIKPMSEDDIRLLFSLPDLSKPIGRRDRFLLMYMYDTAARVQEIANTCITDVKVGCPTYVTLHGKGRKSRTIPLMENTAKHLETYLAEFHHATPHGMAAPLFYTRHSGKLTRMGEDNIRRIVDYYGKITSGKLKSVTGRLHPHLFRHTRATHLYENGMPLPLLAEWLGHSQMETTLIYAKANPQMMQRAIAEATTKSNPLFSSDNMAQVHEGDEEMLKVLAGLK